MEKEKIDQPKSLEHSSVNEQIAEIKELLENNLAGEVANNLLQVQAETQKILKQNLEISKELYSMTKKIKRWIAWQKVWAVIKVLIILIPITLGLIYLPALLQDAIKPYQELLNLGGNQKASLDLDNITDQIKNNGNLIEKSR